MLTLISLNNPQLLLATVFTQLVPSDTSGAEKTAQDESSAHSMVHIFSHSYHNWIRLYIIMVYFVFTTICKFGINESQVKL